MYIDKMHVDIPTVSFETLFDAGFDVTEIVVGAEGGEAE